jgi:hypothetical protein
MAYDVDPYSVEPMVDGMIDLLRVNLVANTTLTQDAHIGDKVLHVDNSVRFQKFDYVILMDNNSSRNDLTGLFDGAEIHRVSKDFEETSLLYLAEPIQKDFLVSDGSRIQKAIKKVILYEKDILYGDRQVITFESVAICVEPVSKSQDWLAISLLGNDIKMSIMVYVKCAGQGEQEEYAMRTCNSYADAINRLLLGNIHLDVSLDVTPLVQDAHAGDTGVYIDCDLINEWEPGIECLAYEVEDNHGANQLLKIVDIGESSSSSSSISSVTIQANSSSSSSSASSVSSVLSSLSLSSASSETSSSSWSSQSEITGETSSISSDSSTSGSFSSGTSESTRGSQPGCWVQLYKPLTKDFLVKDKAVLRRKKRYTYDSRVDNIEYGTVQKGSVLLKAARLSWFGKEAQPFRYPQVGLGRQEPTSNE